MKAAVLKALERRGWDKSGRAKADLGAAAGKGIGNEDLKGTLQVHVLAKILQATGEEVKREAQTLVGIVSKKVENERKQRASRKGNNIADQACVGK